MNKPAKLPFRITLLLWLVLIITAWQVVRMVTSLAWRDTLSTYVSFPEPLYIGATGAVWAILGLIWLAGFWRGTTWNRPYLLIASIAYTAWAWADRFLVRAEPGANWPFALLANLVLLGFTLSILLDPRNHPYFAKRGL